MERKKIVVIGGGTGTSMMLRGFREQPVDLAVLVSMADDGGSSGQLRRELNVLPPGDARLCLLALSHADQAIQDLVRYRFTEGVLKGHTVGNLMIAAIEKRTGSFEQAMTDMSDLLKIQGEVIPVSLDKMHLGVIHGPDRARVMGEHIIDENLPLGKPRVFFLEPRATINPRADQALRSADVIVIGPGSISTSLIPVLIVDGIREAIGASKAKLVYNVNITTTPGQTDGYTVMDYVADIEPYLPRPIDLITYHNGETPEEIKTQIENGATLIPLGSPSEEDAKRLISADLLLHRTITPVPGDPIVRKTISHNAEALAELILRNC